MATDILLAVDEHDARMAILTFRDVADWTTVTVVITGRMDEQLRGCVVHDAYLTPLANWDMDANARNLLRYSMTTATPQGSVIELVPLLPPREERRRIAR
jgi:hypothetical protein